MVEDNIDETIRKVVSVHTGENMQLLKPNDLDVDRIMNDAVEIGFASKIQLHDDGGGSIDLEEMFSKIRYFVKSLGCTVILVDPLHTAIKNLSNENIEEVMDRFIKLCKETKATVILSTPIQGKPDDGSPSLIRLVSMMSRVVVRYLRPAIPIYCFPGTSYQRMTMKEMQPASEFLR